jgi:tetratricopeptide (TPR) repeat protein
MFRFLAQVILLGVLLIAPWLYGSVYEQTQVGLLAGLLVALLFSSFSGARATSRFALIANLIMFAAICWAAFQLVPLPVNIAEIISPNTVALRAELDPSAAELPQTLTLRPSATRYDLTLLVMATIAFLLGQRLFDTERSLVVLFTFVAINGAAFAFFGLIQKLTWNGQFFWIGAPYSGNQFAMFVNRNNAGGYLNLCMAAGIGLLMRIILERQKNQQVQKNVERTRGTRRHSSRRVRRSRSPRSARRVPSRSLSDRTADFFASLTGVDLGLLGLCVCMAGGVLASLSRGAGISLFVAVVVTAIALGVTRRKSGTAIWIVMALVAGLGLLSWSGLMEAWQARMGTLEDPDALMARGRWTNWVVALRSLPHFPVAGTGLGTYRDIYLMYQDSWVGLWHFYAENQYLQALTDAGIVGLVLLIAILLVVLVQAFRLMSVSTASSVVFSALGYALLFAMITQGVHAFFDFGLYFPPAMTLLAVISGASFVRRKTQSSAHTTDVEVRRVRVPIFAVALLGAGVYLNYDLYLSAVVRDAIIEYRHTEALGDATDEEIVESIRSLTPFAERRPDDAELQYQIGKLHMHRYRNARFADLRANAPIDVTVEQLWDASAPAYANEENPPGSDHTTHNQQLEHLEQARSPLLAARRAAPVLAKAHLRLAAVVAATEGLEAGAAHVERAVRCEPSDTYKLSEAGRLHLVADRAEDAFKLWRRSLTLNPDRLPEILRWSSELTDEQLVGEILPLDAQFLLAFSQRSGIVRDRPALPSLALEQADRVLDDQPGLTISERSYLDGRINTLQDNIPQAIRHYVAAVTLQPGNAQWRYELAVLLVRQGLPEQAREQAALATRLAPDNATYRNLHAKLVKTRHD